MIVQGFDLYWQMDKLIVCGYVEVLGQIFEILWICGEFKCQLLVEWLDVFIGVDVFDFNFSVEQVVCDVGILLIYFVCLLIWVWCGGWIKKIVKFVDYMLCLFLFELVIFDKVGVVLIYVGYLLVDDILFEFDMYGVCIVLGLLVDGFVIVVLLGSWCLEIVLIGLMFFVVMVLMQQCEFGVWFVMLVVMFVLCELLQLFVDVYL